MQLSVVIPVHNGAAVVSDLLASLAAQRLDGIAGCEFIAVDDGSHDATGQLLAAHSWLRVLHHSDCRGAGAARNTGAGAAKGDFILFLDADTRIRDPDFLRKCVAAFEAHPEDDAISGCYYDRNSGAGAFARYLDVCEAAMRADGLDRPAAGALSGSVCCIRRTVFLSLGGFSEHARVALEDPELGCRLHMAGHRTRLSGALRVEHRQPGFLSYLRELVPRTRNYMQLIRHYRIFNPMMGGAAEGFGRGALVLGVCLLVGAIALPRLAPLGVLSLALAAWMSRRFLRDLARSEGVLFVPIGLAFHVATSAAIVLGGGLALKDMASRGIRSRLVDAAVVLAYLRSLLSPGSPGYLIQFLTHRCNAHCRHCFDDPQRRTIGRGAELDLPRIERLAQRTGVLGHLSLTGGEPLLRDDLADIIAAYYRAGVRSISVSTNGSYPEKLAALLARLPQVAPFGRIMVTLSVDGVGADHDRLRGVPGLFAKVEQSLRLLCEARQWLPQLRVHACIAATAENAARVPAILAHLQQFQLDQLEMTRLRGKPADASLQGVDDATYDHLGACVAEANGPASGLARVFSLLDRAMFAVVKSPQQPWPCGACLAGHRLAVIHADGSVLPCEMIRDVRSQDAANFDNFIVGRLIDHNDDLRALLRGDRARRAAEYIRRTQCRCSFECAIFTTMVYRPWTLPRFLVRGTFAAKRSGFTLHRREEAGQCEPQQHGKDPRRGLEGRELRELLHAEEADQSRREYPVLFAPRTVTSHVRPQPCGGRHDQHEVV